MNRERSLVSREGALCSHALHSAFSRSALGPSVNCDCGRRRAC